MYTSVNSIPPQYDNINITIRQGPSRVTLHALPKPSDESRGGGGVLALGSWRVVAIKSCDFGFEL